MSRKEIYQLNNYPLILVKKSQKIYTVIYFTIGQPKCNIIFDALSLALLSIATEIVIALSHP